MTLRNISNNKNDDRKVELTAYYDGKVCFTSWFKNWKCFVRTKTYKTMLDKELVHCIIKEYNDWHYISVAVDL